MVQFIEAERRTVVARDEGWGKWADVGRWESSFRYAEDPLHRTVPITDRTGLRT